VPQSGSGGANTALGNLASVSINTSLLAQTGVDLGSTTKPFRDLYLFGSGTFATTYLKLTGTPTSTRTWTFPDTTDTVVGKATTDVFTNKTLIATSNTVEEITSTSSSATPTPTGGSLRNLFTITAQAAAAAFAAPSGSPAHGNYLTIILTSDSSARALTWDGIYRASTDLALPTTTTASKTMWIMFRYNNGATKWDLLAVINGF
jgi:hypothetical protein